MRNSLLVLCFLSLSCLSWTFAKESNVENGIDSVKLQLNPIGGGLEQEDEDITPGDLIEENPDFAPDDSEDSDGSDSDSDSDDENDIDDEEEESEDAKTKLSKKLKKTKKGPLRLLKKNRTKITLALAVFAFRKELFKLLLYLLDSYADRPATNILKLLLFVDFMRRMQSRDPSVQGGGKPSLVKTVGTLIDRALDSNPAYVPPIDQHFCFESLNEYYVKDGMALQKSIRNKHVGLKWPSSSATSGNSPFASSKSNHESNDKETTENRTVVVLDWTKLDEQITRMTQLRQEVSFLLSEYRSQVMKGEQVKTNTTTNATIPPLEVVLLLESPGGSVSDYGLAGQHLLRLRNEPGITLTICVDKVAASGGYMLCCTASPGKLYASPFAYLGSIGVIATQINVRKLLTNWGIEPLEYRGGRYKAPIGLLGKISKDGRKVTQTMVDEIHKAFKEHVVNARPILKDKIEEIGNGSVWLGTDALNLGLVDALKTSDEYIEAMIKDGVRVFKMLQAPRSGFLFGPRIGHYNTIKEDPRQAFAVKDDPSLPAATIDHDAKDAIQKSKTAMLRLPAHAKSLFSKSLQSFQ